MNLYQYGRVAIVQLTLEGFVAKAMSILAAIPVHSSMFCCKLKLSRIQMLSRVFKNAVVVNLMANIHL